MAYTPPKTWQYKESISSADLNTFVRDNIIALDDRYCPVGSVREFGVATNAATLMGFGTWVEHGKGCTTVAINAPDVGVFDTLGAVYGAKSISINHTHVGVNHLHTFSGRTDDSGYGPSRADGGNSSVSNHGHNFRGTTDAADRDLTTSGMNTNLNPSIVQPSIVVYRWIRTA